jgi:hypothetical protein
LAAADVWATGISPDSYPTQFLVDLDEWCAARRRSLSVDGDGY